MEKWERIVDRLIVESIGDGDVSHLPGSGKKLSLNEDSNTPPDLRVAFKIMQDHDVMPEWIEAGKRLAQVEAELRSQLRERARRRQSKTDAACSAATAAHAEKVESAWRRYQEKFLERVERYNREALAYNLALPSGIPHRQILRGEALIKQALRREPSE